MFERGHSYLQQLPLLPLLSPVPVLLLLPMCLGTVITRSHRLNHYDTWELSDSEDRQNELAERPSFILLHQTEPS